MTLSPKIEPCTERRHCRYLVCRAPVQYRVLTVINRQRGDPFYQELYYCAPHAAKWAKSHGVTLPEGK